MTRTFNSLRVRLAAALLLLMMLGAGAASVLSMMRSQSSKELLEETSLAAQARVTARSFDVGARGKLQRTAFPKGWEDAYRDPKGAFFTLYDADGDVLARSPNASAPLARFAPLSAGALSSLSLGGADQRLTEALGLPEGRQLVVARVNPGVHSDTVDDRLGRFMPLLAAGGLVLAAALIVAVVTEWSLRPLNRAVQEARRVGPERPELRLSLVGLPSELLPLGAAVNQALDRVSEALQAQRRFTVDSAHALRTPLTVLDLRLQKMQPQTPALKGLRDDLDEVIRIVADLLRLASDDQADVRAPPVRANLARAVREAAATIAPLLDASGRRLDVDVPDVLEILSDAGRWRDAVGALLDNARVHGAGNIGVHLRLVGSDAVLSVSDEGGGVLYEAREAVFARFHKVSGATPGAGLGLAIVRQTARAAGGDAKFESAATVQVRVPAL